MFYERDAGGIPRRWLQVVKQSIRTVLPRFSTRRMVKEYVQTMYRPSRRKEPVGR
jgi:starch phosphorylase